MLRLQFFIRAAGELKMKWIVYITGFNGSIYLFIFIFYLIDGKQKQKYILGGFSRW